MKATKFNNTWLIIIGIVLTLGSIALGFTVRVDYFFFSIVFLLATAIFATLHGKEKLVISK